ncbi:ferritin family protein [Thermococcus sp.]
MKLGESSRNRLREIISELLKMDSRGIMSYWVSSEFRKAEMYYRLYRVSKETTWDERISEVFFSLYMESIGHAEKLLGLYKKMFPGEKPVPIQLQSLEVEMSEYKLEEMLKRGRISDLFGILIGSEETAAELYNYLMEHAGDSDLREILAHLAQSADGYSQRLREIYAALG